MSKIYKKLLRNKPLTAGDIYDYYAKDKLFKGIFSIHQKLPSLRKKQFIVLNLDYPQNGGTHWVCLYKLTSRNYFYFDAFGVLAPDSILKKYKHITYQNEDLQQLKSARCGGFCLFVLDKLKKYTPRAIINAFTQDDSLQNEWMVIYHFK